MNRTILNNIARFFGFGLAQVFVLKEMNLWWAGFHYFQIFLYPLFILLLPFRAPQQLILFLSFVMGIFIDGFYDSMGVHASASVFTAALRPWVLAWVAPRGGYDSKHVPTKAQYGLPWFLRYASILMGIHLLFYFSVESFTFVNPFEIFLKTVGSGIISMIFIWMTIMILNPKE
ncbi:MAG: hypothetical protein SFU99_07785 [Saprospiraceae bacterium]|nr:hypothetical protein [Saprospiraceae bacterium]